MPSPRQLLLLGLLWAVFAWLTTAFWGVTAQKYGFADALTRYYAVRAPLVGVVAGVVWAPALCAPLFRGHGSALSSRPFERARRQFLHLCQGALVGQLVGGSATAALLFLWPGDMQNTRMDALKWAVVFWRLYWWLFAPCSGLAGVLSVTLALRTRRFPES